MESDIRELLNKMKWHTDYRFDEVEIWFANRGYPGDIDSVCGTDIIGIKPHFFQTIEKLIPYHRILRIDYEAETIFIA